MSTTLYPDHPLLALIRTVPAGHEVACFPAGKRLTAGKLHERALGLARALHGWGVRPGGRVAILLRNSPEALVALVACWAAGAVAMPLNPRWRVPELAAALEAGAPWLVLTEAASRPGLAARARAAARPDVRVLVLDGRLDLATVAAGAPDPPGTDRPGDPAIVLHSSGTTARPRACRLAGDRLATNARASAERFGFGPQERLWNPLPLCHVGGLLPWLALLPAGGTLLTAPRFEPASALALLRRHRATFAYPMFPHILQALLDEPGFAAADLPDLRAFTQVATEPQLRAAQAALPGAALISAYGSTEAVAVSFGDPGEPEAVRLTSCGRPLPGVEVRIEAGELLVRGGALLLGWDGTDASPVDAGGWYHTGDAAALDATGRLRYLGRFTDMLKVGGENVSPAEVEAWLCGHPAVRQAVVVGLADDRLGEVPAAAVELAPGAEVAATDLIAHCGAGLAAFKVPVLVRFVTAWPMSATKIRRAAVRDLLLEGPQRP